MEETLAHLDWILVVGDDLLSSQSAVDLTGPRVFATAGMHPYQAAEVDAAALEALRVLATHPSVVALGEMGLDYYRGETAAPVQRQAFSLQLELAAELQLPVVVHSRDAHDDTLAVLREFAPRLAGGVMHCFDGGAHFAEACVDLGFHLSFAGNATFKKRTELREAACAAPLDRILVETDSPYLSPEPVRGKKPCLPVYVKHTAACLAKARGMDFEEFASATAENAARLFSVNSSAPA
jgi:TatD DNase family protein